MPSKKKKYNARFPPARIKKIMQTDEDVGKVAAAVPVIISRALELFIESLILKSNDMTQSRMAKTLSAAHIKHIIESEKKFDFLRDLVADMPNITETDLPPIEDDEYSQCGLDSSDPTPPGASHSRHHHQCAAKSSDETDSNKPVRRKAGRPRKVKTGGEQSIPKKRARKRKEKKEESTDDSATEDANSNSKSGESTEEATSPAAQRSGENDFTSNSTHDRTEMPFMHYHESAPQEESASPRNRKTTDSRRSNSDTEHKYHVAVHAADQRVCLDKHMMHKSDSRSRFTYDDRQEVLNLEVDKVKRLQSKNEDPLNDVTVKGQDECLTNKRQELDQDSLCAGDVKRHDDALDDGLRRHQVEHRGVIQYAGRNKASRSETKHEDEVIKAELRQTDQLEMARSHQAHCGDDQSMQDTRGGNRQDKHYNHQQMGQSLYHPGLAAHPPMMPHLTPGACPYPPSTHAAINPVTTCSCCWLPPWYYYPFHDWGAAGIPDSYRAPVPMPTLTGPSDYSQPMPFYGSYGPPAVGLPPPPLLTPRPRRRDEGPS